MVSLGPMQDFFKGQIQSICHGELLPKAAEGNPLQFSERSVKFSGFLGAADVLSLTPFFILHAAKESLPLSVA